MKWCPILISILSMHVQALCQNPQVALEVATISQAKLEENSGIDFSKKHQGVFWTLNDSGNKAEVFAIDVSGKNLGTFAIDGAENIDWEEIALASCYFEAKKDCIYIADTGNNKRDRKSFDIYVVEEPQKLDEKKLVAKKLSFKFKAGEYNFEAFSINEKNHEFYLISKSDKKEPDQGTSTIFAFTASTLEPKVIGKIDFKKFREPLEKADMIVTSSDFDSASQTFLIGTYGNAFEIGLSSLASFSAKANMITVPKMDQAESIAYFYDKTDLAIMTSSEGENQPLYKISCSP